MLESDDELPVAKLRPQAVAVQTHARVYVLLESLEILRESEDHIDELNRAERLLSVLADEQSNSQFYSSLFPTGVATGSGFYETLGCVASNIGFNEKAARAIGIIWLDSVNKIEASSRNELLHEFVSEKSNYFFENITGLPTLLESLALPRGEMLDWLAAILTTIENDGCQGSFWDGLRVMADKRPSESFGLITSAIECQSKQGLRIGSFLLGLLRSKTLGAHDAGRMRACEDRLALSGEPALRGSLHWSWATTASEVGLDEADVANLIDRADRNEHGDRICLVQVFCKLIGCRKIAHEYYLTMIRWLNSQVGSGLDDESKYHVVNAVLSLVGEDRASDSTVNTKDWLAKIQPISIENLGTWRAVESCFSRLKEEQIEFRRLFLSLAAICGQTLLDLFRKPRTFDRFLRDIALAKPNQMISELILSPDGGSRRLGLFLFDKLGTSRIAKRLLDSASDERLCGVFYELQRQVLEPTAIARIMWSLTPRFELMNEQMQTEFVDLLQMQAKNHPGGFRSEIRKLAKDHTMIQQLLNQFACYETAYLKARDTGIAKIRVPGALRAARMHARHTSQKISKSVDEHSLISQMCKKVFVTYGNAHGYYMAGNLSEPTRSEPIKTDFEIPQIEFTNPEEMALRRFRALSSMNATEEPVAEEDCGETQNDG